MTKTLPSAEQLALRVLERAINDPNEHQATQAYALLRIAISLERIERLLIQGRDAFPG